MTYRISSLSQIKPGDAIRLRLRGGTVLVGSLISKSLGEDSLYIRVPGVSPYSLYVEPAFVEAVEVWREPKPPAIERFRELPLGGLFQLKIPFGQEPVRIKIGPDSYAEDGKLFRASEQMGGNVVSAYNWGDDVVPPKEG